MSPRLPSFQRRTPELPDTRGQAVLCAIIKEHLVSGEPVGSKTISDRFSRAHGWGSATIRSLMVELEESGLLEQPHTSAGRIPTDAGYRFYVNNMLGDASLSRTEKRTIDEILLDSRGDAEVTGSRLMERVSHALSTISDNVGIVVSPSLADTRLSHIEFVSLADRRILVVIVTSSNSVYNKLIRFDAELSQEDLDRVARYVNSEFSGKTLNSIRAEILRLMGEEKSLYDQLLHNAIMLCDRSLEGELGVGDVFVDGASNILSKPEFSDLDRMRDLFKTFEEKSRLLRILDEVIARDLLIPGEVMVVIGRENPSPTMRNCALISAPYRIDSDGAVGTLSVVGPTRIEYARMMAVVNYMACYVEQVLNRSVHPS